MTYDVMSPKHPSKEQIAEFTYLPPLPSEPIYDFPYESDVSIYTDNENIKSTRLPATFPRPSRRQRPPPIPPRLAERKKVTH